MTEETTKGSGKKILTGLAAGAVAGAVAGILLAPKSGKAIRKELKEVADRIGKDVAGRTEKIEKLTEEEYHRIIEEASNLYRKAKKIKEEDVKEIIDDFKTRWPEILRKLQK